MSGELCRGEEGFTLVELLVVLAILALLALIATPQVLKYLDRAKVSAAHTQVESLSSALDLYKLDVGRYPTTEEGLEALVVAPAGSESWNGPYIKKKASLTDPWGHPYVYRSPGEHDVFDLSSNGPDGGGGNAPPITSW